LIVLLVLILFCRFVFWLLKKFFRFICCCWRIASHIRIKSCMFM
jgi:hypothetical protein